MISPKINCANFSRLVWRRHTCHTASGATGEENRTVEGDLDSNGEKGSRWRGIIGDPG